MNDRRRSRHVLSTPAGRQDDNTGMAGLQHALRSTSRSTAIQVLGDSTGNDSTEWVYLTAQALAADYPEWSVHYRLWDDATQDYAATSVLQTGTAGARYLDGDTAGEGSRRLSVAQSPHIAGTIDVRIKLSLPDWTPAAQHNLCGRSNVNGTRGWYLLLNPSGILGVAYSTDGTAVTTHFANAATGITDGATSWVRAVFIPNDGAGNRVGRFYKSTDGVAWTQIGATMTTAGAVTLFNPTYGYEVGGVQGVVAGAGIKVYEIQVRDGENGKNVVPALPDLWPPASATGAEIVGAPILTVVNGSKAGADIAYLSDATRLPKMTPNYGQSVTILSCSHNQAASHGRDYLAVLGAWHTAVEAQTLCPTVVITQNPQTAAASYELEQDHRRRDLMVYAAQKRLTVLDTYKLFTDLGDFSAYMTDSIHPNSAGQALMRDLIHQALVGAP